MGFVYRRVGLLTKLTLLDCRNKRMWILDCGFQIEEFRDYLKCCGLRACPVRKHIGSVYIWLAL
jgi:hypothetical protein